MDFLSNFEPVPLFLTFAAIGAVIIVLGLLKRIIKIAFWGIVFIILGGVLYFGSAAAKKSADAGAEYIKEADKLVKKAKKNVRSLERSMEKSLKQVEDMEKEIKKSLK